MAQAHHDSSFELTFIPLAGKGGRAPAASGGQRDELPLLDLDSSGPLPELSPEGPLPAAPAIGSSPSLASLTLPTTNRRVARGPGSLWLQGDVLMCSCPDCAAPMSVRLWLMVADCWKCRTSIELSEEQEREARRLLRQREQQLRAAGGTAPNGRPSSAESNGNAPTENAATGNAAPEIVEARLVGGPTSAAPSGDAPSARESTNRQRESQRSSPDESPARARRRKRTAARRPVGARAKIRRMAVTGGVRVWISDVFGNLPAWLVSFVFHVVLLILLNLFLISEEPPQIELVLTTEISPQRREGGDTEAQLAQDDVVFDLPVPNQDYLKNDALREVLIKADQQARLLRLDPNDPTTDLPPLEKVQNLLTSSDTVRRTFAARDPRMRVEMVKAEGGTTLTEAAVARALRWLARQQNDDGGWGRSLGRSDTAGTSLALLPFLGAGQTPQTGIYKDDVAKGLRWMIERQQDNGDLRYFGYDRGRDRPLDGGNNGMYAQGQGAIVLCEAYALTGDEQLRGPAQKAIDFIVDAQNVAGGWRYQPGQAGDTSVLGWQLMALHSARAAGLNTPETSFELASNYLDTVQTNAGARYFYLPNNRNDFLRATRQQDKDRLESEAMIAEGLLCRMYIGWKRDNPALDEGLEYLMTKYMPPENAHGPANIYYWYYATQVAHHLGGEPWKRWNLRMRHVLVESQLKDGRFAGAWRPRGPHAGANDWLYMTALAACCLEVYYRHAPLFRQLDLDQPPPAE